MACILPILLPGCRSVQALYDAAYKADNNNEYDAAINYYSQILAIDSTNYRVFHLRGKVYYSQKKYQRAFEDANRAIALNSLFANGYYLRAVCYYRWNRYREAIDDYSTLVKLRPTVADPYLYRGKSYAQLQQYDSALADYARILRDLPKHYETYQARAALYSTQQNYELALKDYDKAVEYLYEEILLIQKLPTPSSRRSSVQEEFIEKRSSTLQEYYEDLAFYLRERGNMYLALYQPSEGLIDFRESLRWDSVNASTYTAMSRACYLLKDFPSGQSYAQKALRYQESLLLPRYTLALCTLCAGDTEAAIRYYRETVDLDANAPTNQEKARMYASSVKKKNTSHELPVAIAIQDLRELIRQGVHVEEAKRILHDIFFTDIDIQ